jgi:hypothetical protein
MSDALVKLLNSYGYQPVFLPRTGVAPPELYNFADHKLIRRGALATYIKGSVVFQPTTGRLSSIEGRITSGKKVGAAVGFLKNALAVLGLGSLPKIDLSFAGSHDFVFSFVNVTYQSIEPAVLDPIIQGLTMPLAIPDEYVSAGAMHIAYEYVYASTLTMSRLDGKTFSGDVSGGIGNYIDLGLSGKVQVTGNSTVSFSAKDDNVAAFAYKAGRLQKKGRSAMDFRARNRHAWQGTRCARTQAAVRTRA